MASFLNYKFIPNSFDARINSDDLLVNQMNRNYNC